MLRFAVYENGSLAESMVLQHCHLLGPDDIGLPGEITFDRGCLICEKKTVDAAALCLMVDAGSAGRLVLQTCLLPDRDEPYLLYLELARHRLKSFLVKLEDWLLYVLPFDHPVMKQWCDARDTFTQAMIMARSDPAQADALARTALEQAIEASENLAIMHADALLARRYADGRMPGSALGCRIHQAQFAEPLTKIVGSDFDYISVPIRWREIEPEEGQYDWSRLDRWMDWARRKRYPVMAGPIIDFRSHSVPEWLYIWEHDYDTTHDLLHEHLESVITRYRDVVSVWNVASSLHINANFTLAYDELMDVIRMATSLAKALHPAGKTMVEVSEPWGEYYAGNTRSIPPVLFAESLAQSGFKLDLIAVTIELGTQSQGRGTRDLMQISSLLDRLMYLSAPVVVSGIAAPSHRPKVDGPDPAGWWREPWNPNHQGQWLSKVAALALSKPFVESVCIQELFDHTTIDLPCSGLITATGRAKPALTEMGRVHAHLEAGTFRCSHPDERIWVIEELPSDSAYVM